MKPPQLSSSEEEGFLVEKEGEEFAWIRICETFSLLEKRKEEEEEWVH